MSIRICTWIFTFVTAIALTGSTSMAAVPFGANFDVDAENWKDSAFMDVTQVANGGLNDSGYISTELSLFGLPSGPILFRAHDEFGSSGLEAGVGHNWLAEGVNSIQAYLRHDAPVALDFFARIATPGNHPAVAIELADPVEPGVWTLVEFDIQSTNPLLTIEGPPIFYNSTFTNVGHVQFGVSISPELADDPTAYTFDLDGVSTVVPEPATWLLALGVAMAGVIGRRPRRQ